MPITLSIFIHEIERISLNPNWTHLSLSLIAIETHVVVIIPIIDTLVVSIIYTNYVRAISINALH